MVHSGSGVDETTESEEVELSERTVRRNEIHNELALLFEKLENFESMDQTIFTRLGAETVKGRIHELQRKILADPDATNEVSSEELEEAVEASDSPDSLVVPYHQRLFKMYENSHRHNGPFEHWRVVPGYTTLSTRTPTQMHQAWSGRETTPCAMGARSSSTTSATTR